MSRDSDEDSLVQSLMNKSTSATPRTMPALNSLQFNPDAKEQPHYQRPLPGMEGMGKSNEVPVRQIFKHSERRAHPAEYHMVQNYQPTTVSVNPSVLRPTQPHVEEKYLYESSKSSGNPRAIRDSLGYHLVDGHHRAARALLNGEKTINVDIHDVRPKRR